MPQPSSFLVRDYTRTEHPEDPIFGLYAAFQADPRPYKINLAIGIYKDAEDKVPLLAAVRQAEKEWVEKALPKTYLPIEGHPELLQETQKLVFGLRPEASLLSVQSIGGSGGLSVGGFFLASQGFTTVFLPEPSWPNHQQLFTRAGLKIAYYPYCRQGIDFEALVKAIREMPARSIILLHASCHNPSGLDLELAQWEELEKLIKKQQLLPFFDLAYQGLGQGLEEDAAAVRLFAEKGHEMLVSSSFSKNLSFYGERLGVLTYVSPKPENLTKVASHFKRIIRSLYSNPPLHGACLVAKILQTPALKKLWEEELVGMRARLSQVREALIPLFPAIKDQRGLFFMSGLNKGQVERLREEQALYLLENGRLNIAAIHAGNRDKVMKALAAV